MPRHRVSRKPDGLSWYVSEEKIRQYLLKIDHPIGGAKARFLLARGFSLIGWQELGSALREHPVTNPIESEQETKFGRKLTVRCRISTPDGTDPCIRTVWMVEPGTPPRLVTAYPSID
jgi:hypothetical protein